MVDSKAFLWLPSSVWFEFLRRRLDTLIEHQVQLHKRNPPPPNYAVMTGLFTYLMQSVLFTPAMVNSYVTQSLACLNYKATLDRSGMLFLHDLDMTKKICLPGVLVKDDLDIFRTLGLKARHVPHQRRLSPDNDEEEEAYPIGKTPSWQELATALKAHPWVVMRRWAWPSDLDQYRDAEEGLGLD